MIREKNYCEECRYSREFYESMVNEGPDLICTRYAPRPKLTVFDDPFYDNDESYDNHIVAVIADWPRVYGDNGCGEWEEKTMPDTSKIINKHCENCGAPYMETKW